MSGILFDVELLEGKAHTHQAGPLEFEDLDRKNVGLLLHAMKRYLYTGGYIILDSVFSVLKGLIQLKKKGIFRNLQNILKELFITPKEKSDTREKV